MKHAPPVSKELRFISEGGELHFGRLTGKAEVAPEMELCTVGRRYNRSQFLRLLLHHTSTSESMWLCLPTTGRPSGEVNALSICPLTLLSLKGRS
jgi:hypothetical protein